MATNTKSPPLVKSQLNTLPVALDFMKRVPNAYIFPIAPLAKFPPLVDDNLGAGATNNLTVIKQLHKNFPGCNWGVALAKSNLLVVDVDTKDGKQGAATFDALDKRFESHGFLPGFPPTFTVTSPSGGRHLYYDGKHVFALGEHGFGDGIDSPNYVLLPGCWINDKGVAKFYRTEHDDPIVVAPSWFYDVLNESNADAVQQTPAVDLDQDPLKRWAIHYLTHDAPPSIQGQNGEKTLLTVFGVLKDAGISKGTAVELALEHYNPRCTPMWSGDPDAPVEDRMQAKADNAFQYLTENAPGSDTAEAIFGNDPIEDPDPLLDDSQMFGTATINDVLREWVWVAQVEKFVRLSDGTMWTRKQFDSMFNFLATSTSISTQLFKTRGKIKRYERLGFLPGRPLVSGTTLNTWRPSPIKPVKGDTKLWNEHINYLFAPALGAMVLDWMAWNLQNPSKKLLRALLIVGRNTGTGKSIIARVFEQLIGEDNTKRPKNSSLKGDFNAWAVQCKLCIIEELMMVGRREVANELRDIITEPQIEVNIKGISAFQILNFICMMAISNHPDALPIDPEDRRWLIIETVVPRNSQEGYYERLVTEVLKSPEALSAIYYELLHRDLSNYQPYDPAPVTAAKMEMISRSLNDVAQWMTNNTHQPPLSYQLVTGAEVIAALPEHLQRTKSIWHVVGDALRQEPFKAFNYGNRHVDEKKGRLPPLWGINGFHEAHLKNPTTPKQRVEIYKAERAKANKSAAATEVEDLGFPEED